MSYTRVIPRDFFNEAKLLKCMGQLALKILDHTLPEGMNIKIRESGKPFNIEQFPGDGSLFVSNYQPTINGLQVPFYTKYNSMKAYPMYAMYDEEEYLVFDNNGNFTDEFSSLAKIAKG